MKLRSCLALSSLLFIVFSVNAQKHTTILEAGMNTSWVSITNGGRFDKANTLISYQLGLTWDKHLSKSAYLQSGIHYTGKGAKMQLGEENQDAIWYKSTSNPFYLEIPLNLVLKSKGKSPVFAGVGPYMAFGVGGKNKVEGKMDNTFFKSEDKIKFTDEEQGTTLPLPDLAGFPNMHRLDYGFNILAGVECKKLVFRAQYGYGLAKLAPGYENDKNKMRVLSFTLGMKL
jgi:hypothetical protein